MGRKEDIFHFLKEQTIGISANDIATQMELERANVSRYLNELNREGLIEKTKGKPILYSCPSTVRKRKKENLQTDSFHQLIGTNDSLKIAVQQAKAAIHYPPRGLHTLILGKTGTGKSFFAECMYHYAIESKRIQADAPFIQFNCADYAQNPQLLFGHIFGVKKGAFTGATEDRIGLIAKADKGILFLDEIHRLPPEGQEMLFTFIDKGLYRSLGDSEQTKTAAVQIIGATTEIPESYLLETFTRRIPVTITLPSLEERQMEERFQLVEHFLQQESARLSQTIALERETLIAFLLYRTTANIGQLQRDLKLACAKAFLHSISKPSAQLLIRQNDLPIHVQKGLLDAKQYREKMSDLITNEQQIFIFASNDSSESTSFEENDFYQDIESKLRDLQDEGKDQEEIQQELLVDFKGYFNEVIEDLPQAGLAEIVSHQIRELADRIYRFAEQQLNRTFNQKMRFAFTLHLQRTIERIQQNNSISNPNLNKIHAKYPNEFKLSIEIAQMIELEVELDIPLDEIGYITMFLVSEVEEKMITQEDKVLVIIMMHGNTTASSMLMTVQDLLGVQLGKAFDMPLSMEAKQMYELVVETINEVKPKRGTLCLVDMGSLASFGHMITEETGLKTRTISMTSTPVVMEAIRKASLGRSLEDIYQSCSELFESQFSAVERISKPVKKVIITACFTGDGVAKILKSHLETVIVGKDIELISIQFLHRQSFTEKIEQLLEEYDILAIVGTVHFEYRDIPYFSPADVFQEAHMTRLRNLIDTEEPYGEMVLALENHFKMIPSVAKLVQLLRKVVQQIELALELKLDSEVKTGVLLHLAFLIENMRLNHPERPFQDEQQFRHTYEQQLMIVAEQLRPLEVEYDVRFEESECMHIFQMFKENSHL